MSERKDLDESVAKNIKENTEWIKKQFSEKLEIELDLNSESIEWIDGYINRNRGIKGKARDNLSHVFGSFLGESIIETYGGEWSWNGDNLGIYFKECDSWAFPYAKTHKHFHNGPEDSIYSFFTLIPKFLDGSLTKGKKES